MNVEPTRNPTSSLVPSTASQTIWSLLREQAEIRGEATAFIAPGRAPLSFEHLFGLVQRTVQGLRTRRILLADRVAVVLPNGPELAAAFLAVSSGAACAPLNPAYRAQEFEFCLRDLGVRAVIVGAGMDSPVRAVAGLLDVPLLELEVEPDGPAGSFTLTGGAKWHVGPPDLADPHDAALLLHTSGTTSRHKLVPLTNANLCASARHIRTTLSLSPADRCLCVMPLFHIHGLMGSVLSSLSAGAGVCCTPGFYAPRFFEWMDQFRPTWFTAVPTMLQSILARAPGNEAVIARRTLRFIRSSSAPLAPALMARLEGTFGVPVVESYGMTEAAHQMASNPLPPGRRKAGSVGLPGGPDIEVMDDSGKPLPRGEAGEVVIRGSNVTLGYENDPVANAAAFTGGWFRTGDRGYLDAERHLRAVRRCRPRGPYYLLGWCFGGQLAYEMARQLRDQNEEVALVALIDCFNHAWLKGQPAAETSRVRRKQFYRRMRFAAGTIPRQSAGENRRYLAAKLRLFVWAWRKRLLTRAYRQKRDAGKPVTGMIADVEFHNYVTARVYVPGPYPGRVTLFRTRVPREGAPEDAVLGWRDLMTGEVEVVEIPGDHYSALSEGHVRFLGEALRVRLLRLQTAPCTYHSSPSK